MPSGMDLLRQRLDSHGSVLLFEDKLGISAGYESIWASLLLAAGFVSVPMTRRNAYRAMSSKVQLLTRSGNRVAPGFNPDIRVQGILMKWAQREVERLKPSVVLCMDPALLFLANRDWDQATIDKLRGGVYRIFDCPWLIMFPISAWHNQKKEKDIARLNEGYTDKEEWEASRGEGDDEDDESSTEEVGSVWLEPLIIPYGKFVLRKDLEKAYRIYTRIQNEKERPHVR